MNDLILGKGKYRRVPEYQTIKHALELVRDREERACFATIYATASRAGEIIGSDRTYIRNPRGKESFVFNSKIPSLCFDNVHFNIKESAIEFDIFVGKKKNNKKVYRNQIVFLESEEWLFNILFDWFFHIENNMIKKNGQPESECFTFGVPKDSHNCSGVRYRHLTYIYSRDIAPVFEMKNSNTHLLRHARISHKIQLFGYTIDETHIEMKWSDLDQALTYAHIASNASNKMKKKAKEE